MSLTKPKYDTLLIRGAGTSKPTLTSLSDKDLSRIIRYMRDSGSSSPNSVQDRLRAEQECRHTFIRPAYSLAITCTRLYRLYRNQMLHPRCFGRGPLLSPTCEPSVCLTPLLNGLCQLHISTSNVLWEDDFVCQIATQEREYGCDAIGESAGSYSSQANKMKVVLNECRMSEYHMKEFFRLAQRFRGVKRLFVLEYPILVRFDLWKSVANAWGTCLVDVIIQDSLSMFDVRDTASLARLKSLKRLRLRSQTVGCIDPLANATMLISLDLKSCLIHDDMFEPVLKNLKNLQHLNISDTCITPRIAPSFPTTLTSLEAGTQVPYRYQQTTYGQTPVCFCVAFTGTDLDHLATCEIMKPGPLNPRWSTKNLAFLKFENLPNLVKLHWGHWSQVAQGIASLAAVLTSLRSLSVFGIDFNDEIIDILPCAINLTVLRLYGCGISDRAAFEIARVSNLQSMTIVNCPLISAAGIYEIAVGEAARDGKLVELEIKDGNRSHPNTIKEELFKNNRTKDIIRNHLEQSGKDGGVSPHYDESPL